MDDLKAFSNQIILPEQLAPLEVQNFEGLDAKYKFIKQINAVIVFIVFVAAFLLISFLAIKNVPVFILISIPLVLALFFTLRLIVVNLGFPKKGYLLREEDISYRSGLLIYKLTSVPFNRIQHVEVSQGLIEKSIGLSTVKIFTAGGSISDLAIPGILPDKAHQIESFLLPKISKHE